MLCDLLPAHGEDALGRKTPLTNPCRKASGRNFSIGRKNRASTELFLYLKVSQLTRSINSVLFPDLKSFIIGGSRQDHICWVLWRVLDLRHSDQMLVFGAIEDVANDENLA